jgi:hypothetical protein
MYEGKLKKAADLAVDELIEFFQQRAKGQKITSDDYAAVKVAIGTVGNAVRDKQTETNRAAIDLARHRLTNVVGEGVALLPPGA